MKYTISKSPSISRITISDDDASINIDVTVFYNIEGGSHLPDATVGYTINMLLDSSTRDTMLSELNTKVQQQFEAQFN